MNTPTPRRRRTLPPLPRVRVPRKARRVATAPVRAAGWLALAQPRRAARTLTRPWGFTLIELLVVMLTIAALATISTVAFAGVTAKAHDVTTAATVRQVGVAVQAHIAMGHYPGDLVEDPDGTLRWTGDSFDIELTRLTGSQELTATDFEGPGPWSFTITGPGDVAYTYSPSSGITPAGDTTPPADPLQVALQDLGDAFAAWLDTNAEPGADYVLDTFAAIAGPVPISEFGVGQVGQLPWTPTPGVDLLYLSSPEGVWQVGVLEFATPLKAFCYRSDTGTAVAGTCTP